MPLPESERVDLLPGRARALSGGPKKLPSEEHRFPNPPQRSECDLSRRHLVHPELQERVSGCTHQNGKTRILETEGLTVLSKSLASAFQLCTWEETSDSLFPSAVWQSHPPSDSSPGAHTIDQRWSRGSLRFRNPPDSGRRALANNKCNTTAALEPDQQLATYTQSVCQTGVLVSNRLAIELYI
jgi:hypothetical protein